MLPDKEPEYHAKDQEPDRGTFPGSDISRPYTSPELDDIALGKDIPDENVSTKTTVKTTITETVSYYDEDKEPEDIDRQPEAKGEEKGRFPGSSDTTHPYKAPDIEGISLVVDDVPTEDKLRSATTVTKVITEKVVTPEEDKVDDTKPEEVKDVGRFKGSDVSHPYKSPDIEGISLVLDAPKEEPIDDERDPEPSEDKLPTETTVTTIIRETVVSEEDDEGKFRGSDISHPYKSPEIEGVSLVADTDERKEEPLADKPRKLSEDTAPEVETEERGTFKGSDVSHPYKAPDIEAITSKTTSTTVITDSVPSKQDDEQEPKEEKEERDRFRGSDISHPYKSPEIEGISLVIDLPKDEKLEPTTKTPEDTRPAETRDRETFKGSDISHPYKSPDIEEISLVQEIPEEEPKEGKVISKTTVTTVITDFVPSKQDEDKQPDEEKEERDRFRRSDISHPYKPPEIEGISLVIDLPKGEKQEPTAKTPEDTRPAETLKDKPIKLSEDTAPKVETGEKDTFKGSDISHPYKAPDIEGISLVQEMPKEEPKEGNVISKTTVTTVIRDSVPSKQDEDQEPKAEHEERDRFRGSDISHPYKSPEIEGISLIKDVPKDERKELTAETPGDVAPEEPLRDRETFKGSVISHPYKSPDIEGISLVQDIPKEEPSEGKVISTTTVTTVVTDSVPSKQDEDKQPEEEKEARDRFRGSDISHPYKPPEMEGITLVTDVPRDEREERTQKTIIEKEAPGDTMPEEATKDRETFKGSVISHPYKSPDIEGISLVQDISKEEPSEGKVISTTTTVTTVVTDSVPSKQDDDKQPEEEKDERDRFRGSDISHPYKSPEIEGISLIKDRPEPSEVSSKTIDVEGVHPTIQLEKEDESKHIEETDDRSGATEDRERSKTTITTVVTEVTKPIVDTAEDDKKDRDGFQGSDISHPYKSPDIEGISLVQEVSMDDEPAKVDEETQPPQKEETDDKTGKEDRQGFEGRSDISIKYKAQEIEGISLISDVKEDTKDQPSKEKGLPVEKAADTKSDENTDEKGRFQESVRDFTKETDEDKRRSKTTVVTETTERTEDEEKFQGSDFSRPYKSPELEGISLVGEESREEKGEPDEDKLQTTITTVVTKTIVGPDDEGRFKGSEFSRTQKSMEIEDIPLFRDEKQQQPEGEERSETTVTKIVTKTVVTGKGVRKQTHEEDTGRFRGSSDVSLKYKAPEIDEIKLAEDEKEPGQKEQRETESEEEWFEISEESAKTKTVEKTTENDQPSGVTVTVKKTTANMVIDEDKTPQNVTVTPAPKEKQSATETDVVITTDAALVTDISEEAPKGDEVDKTVMERKAESDEEWYESSEGTVRSKTVTTTVTTTKGSKATHEKERRRRKSEDILGDDEGSDSDEMPTKTKKVKTIVRTSSKDGSGLKQGKRDRDEYDEDWSATGDSYSTTKTVRTVVTSQKCEDKPDHQTRSIKAYDDRDGKVEGDQEWSESGEYTTKTQTVTTVVTRTTGSHESGDQKVSTISTETGIAGEGTESMGETEEVKRSTTIVERNTNIASANQVSSTIFLCVHVWCRDRCCVLV